MKKEIGKLIVYVAMVVMIVLGFMIANNLLDRENILERITEWPDLEVNTLEGEPFSTADIRDDKPILLYYFNTECIFCQGTFADLPNHPKLVEESNLIFISDEDPGVINQFINDMELGGFTELLFFYDVDRKVKDFYAIRVVPAIYLYDHNGEMTEFYRGAVGLKQISLELNKHNYSD